MDRCEHQKCDGVTISIDNTNPGTFLKTAISSLVIVALIIAVLIGLYFIASYLVVQFCILGSKIKTLDVVIIAAILAGVISILHLFLSKRLDRIERKKAYIFEKKMRTYENIVSFVFKFQKRQGYMPSTSPADAQAACFLINQQVLLWASKEIQRRWEKYLVYSWQKDNDSYQKNAVALFTQIAEEVGQHFKQDSAYDFPALRLFYDIPSFELLGNEGIRAEFGPKSQHN